MSIQSFPVYVADLSSPRVALAPAQRAVSDSESYPQNADPGTPQ